MKDRSQDQDRDLLSSRLKHLVAEMFRLDLLEPEEISDHESLTGGDFDLDSLDTFELAMGIEEVFGVAIDSRVETHRAFASIASLANFIRARSHKWPARPPVRPPQSLVVPALLAA
jgi:acyl carrier protein